MNKNEKCISLKLAEELQKVAKEKSFELPESEKFYIDGLLLNGISPEHQIFQREVIPAYDTAELGEMLSKLDFVFESGVSNKLVKPTEYYCEIPMRIEYAKTEADARVKSLIFLIKNQNK